MAGRQRISRYSRISSEEYNSTEKEEKKGVKCGAKKS
jgi:hypothetical protein